MYVFSILGDNSKLIYSLPKGVANDRFVLDPITGHLTATGTLDREEQSSYLLTGNKDGESFYAIFL